MIRQAKTERPGPYDFVEGANGFRSGKGPGPNRGPAHVVMPCVLKFLAPYGMASSVIGKGGSVIAAMRQSTQAKIALTEQNELYPGTDCRVLIAQGNTEESLTDVSNQIIGRVAECVQVSDAEHLGEANELELKTLVPRPAVGSLIGKSGTSIKHLRDTSGAKISIGELFGSDPSAEQIVTIQGSQQSLEVVMAEVNRQVQALNNEEWFNAWASNPGVIISTEKGHRKGKGSGGGDLGYRNAPPPGLAQAHGDHQGIELMMQVAQSLPHNVMEDARGFAMSCVAPNHLVGGIIGRGGMGTKEVQNATGTKIGIREIPGDPENRSINIAGPLANTCAAYMLMMKRYLEIEAGGQSV